MTKLKNTDEKCECHCHIKRHSCKLDELHLLECTHCNPEKQGDWESRFKMRDFIDELYINEDGEPAVIIDERKLKQFIRQLEKQTRESVIEEVKHHIRNWTDYDIGLMTWIDQLKQKTKE